MPGKRFDRCRCSLCCQGAEHLEACYHRELMAFLSTLNRKHRRLFAAVESNRLGRGGARKVSEITGLCDGTIAHGRRQLADLLQGRTPPKREGKSLGGRPRTEVKYPEITTVL